MAHGPKAEFLGKLVQISTLVPLWEMCLSRYALRGVGSFS